MTMQTSSEAYGAFASALSVRPLSEAAVPNHDPVDLTYDRTIRQPLRLRNANGRKLDGPVREAAAGLIRAADELVQPFRINFLRAALSNDEDPRRRSLDGFRTVCASQLLYAHACDYPELEGMRIDVRPGARLVSQGKHADFKVRFDVGADAETMADPAKVAALRSYGEWGAASWSKIVSQLVGPWLVDSGISELRLCGALVPDRRYSFEVATAGGDDRPAQMH